MSYLRAPYKLLPLILFPLGLSGQRVITTIAGTDWVFPTTAIPGLTAPLGRIASVAIDSGGNVYMADESNNLVLKYDTTGAITVLAGNGQPAFTGDGGFAKNAGLNDPRGVAVDSQGNVYIADSANARVRKVDPDGIITTIAGNGVSTYAGENIPAVQASLANPIEVATDRRGNVYVTDQSQRVRKITPGGIISTIAGNGTTGNSGDGGPATQASFNIPIAIAVDASDNVYITDWLNQRIRRVTPDGIVRAFAGTGENAQQHFVDGVPAAQATFAFPRQLAVASNGAVYVAESGIHRIRRIGPDGIVTTVVGTGSDGFTGDGGPAAKATVSAPSAVAVDPSGNLYIGDTENLRLRKVTTDQTINTIAGNGSLRASPNGGAAVSSVLNAPRGITLDPFGHLFFTNTNDHRVLELLDSVLYITAGNGKRPGIGDGGPAPLAGLNFPSGVVFDSKDNLYIADQFNGWVRKVDTNGIISNFAPDAPFGGLGAFTTGVAIDALDNLYIVDRQSSRIRKETPDKTITFFAGVGGGGYSGDGGPATNARLGFPQAAATDSLGNLYIADTGNHVIRKVAAVPPGSAAGASGIISTVVGNGKAGYAGDGGPAIAANLNAPGGVWVDPGGTIYIADTGNNVIRQVTPDGIITTFAGNGLGGFFGDGGDPAAATLYNPNGIVGDGTGTFYIADTSNNRIRAITGNRPRFEADQSTVNFTATAGSASPGAQTVNLESDVTGVAFTAAADSPWLNIGPAAGTIPAALRVNVDPSNLAAGSYQGIVTITAPLASPSTQSIVVSLTLAAPNPPKLSAQPQAISLSTPEQAAPAQQTVFVANTGSGVLTFDASASSDKGWLKASILNNTALPAAPGAVMLTADPSGLTAGTYQGAVNVASQTTGETAAVPVTLNVTASNRPKLVVSQTGLSFQSITCAGSGPSCLPGFAQCFAVLNAGQGSLDFTVTTDVPAWLKVQKAPCPRSAISSVSAVPEVVVQPIGTLGPGKYEGNITVTAPEADNSPQTVHVVFNIYAVGTNLPPSVDPKGLVFIGTPTQTPGSLDAALINLSPKSFQYSVTPAFDPIPNNWFSAAPQNSTVSASGSSPVRVYPNFSGIPPGAYTGRITLQTASGPQTIEVVAQITPSLGAAGATARALEKCTATQLNPVFTSVSPDFNAPAGLPFRIELYVVDDCGNPLTSGTVVAGFNNGDTAVNLVSLRDGRWSATWTPTNVPDSNRVEITVRARTSDSGIAGEVARSGNLQPPAVNQ